MSPAVRRPGAGLAPADRAEWRRWLAEHHAHSSGVWLVIAKRRSGAPGPSYEEAVEEALCFGWIDSRVERLDEKRFEQWYCPRRPGSIWSLANKERVRRLVEAGLLTPAGLAKVEAARADGSWEILDKVDAREVPEDLAAALAATAGAAEGFGALTASQQKQYLFWVLSAKRATTRAARVAGVVEAAVKGGAASPSA